MTETVEGGFQAVRGMLPASWPCTDVRWPCLSSLSGSLAENRASLQQKRTLVGLVQGGSVTETVDGFQAVRGMLPASWPCTAARSPALDGRPSGKCATSSVMREICTHTGSHVCWFVPSTMCAACQLALHSCLQVGARRTAL